MEFSYLPLELQEKVAFGSADTPNWMTLTQYKELRRTISLVSQPLWACIRNTFHNIVFVFEDGEIATQDYANFAKAEGSRVEFVYVTHDRQYELAHTHVPPPLDVKGYISHFSVLKLPSLELFTNLRALGLCATECLATYGDVVSLNLPNLEYIFAPTRWVVLSEDSRTPKLKKIQSSMVTQLVEKLGISENLGIAENPLSIDVPHDTAFQRFEHKLARPYQRTPDEPLLAGANEDEVKLVKIYQDATIDALDEGLVSQLKCLENVEMLLYDADENLVWGRAGVQPQVPQISLTKPKSLIDVPVQIYPLGVSLRPWGYNIEEYDQRRLKSLVESHSFEDRVLWQLPYVPLDKEMYSDLQDRGVSDIADLTGVRLRLSSATPHFVAETLVSVLAAIRQNRLDLPVEWSGVIQPPAIAPFRQQNYDYKVEQRLSQTVYVTEIPPRKEFFHSRQVRKWCAKIVSDPSKQKTLRILPTAMAWVREFMANDDVFGEEIDNELPKVENLFGLLKLVLYHVL
jgi:hypothetical protein